MNKKDLEPLLWAAISWNAWINLNLDKPSAIAQSNLPQACLKRAIELDVNYLNGLPYVAMGASLAARPKLFGGDIQQARSCFEKALKLSNRKFFLAQYYYIRYYAVRVQDKNLFFRLIKELANGRPHELKDVCLINTIMRKKAIELREMADEYFF